MFTRARINIYVCGRMRLSLQCCRSARARKGQADVDGAAAAKAGLSAAAYARVLSGAPPCEAGMVRMTFVLTKYWTGSAALAASLRDLRAARWERARLVLYTQIGMSYIFCALRVSTSTQAPPKLSAYSPICAQPHFQPTPIDAHR